MRLVPIVLLALVLCAPALACGDSPNAVNLAVTPQVKSMLVAAYGHPQARLVPGRTYYAFHVGIHFAVATFSDVNRPAIFTDDGIGRWRLMRVTHGGICSGVVPIDVIQQWWLVHWRGGCYTEPLV
jgi:hypothetical protein